MIRKDVLILLVILLLHGTINYVWLEKDTTPPAWDHSWFLMMSLYYYRPNHNLSALKGRYPILRHAFTSYPPLFPMVTSGFYSLFGESADTATLSNMLFFAILIFSVYGIGASMYDNKTGVFASFLVSMYPAVFGLSRNYLIDFSLMAMTSLGAYALIKTANFNNFRNSLIFGVVSGLGMLTKPTYAIFLLGPILLSLIMVVKKRDYDAFTNIYILVIVYLMVVSQWYLPRTVSLLTYLRGNIGRSLMRVPYYIIEIINSVSFPLFALLAIGIYSVLRKKGDIRLLLAWILPPYILFTFIYLQDVRYMVPILPAIALLSSFGTMSIKDNKKRKTLIIMTMVICIFQFFDYSFGVIEHEQNVIVLPVGEVIVFGNQYTLAHRPLSEDWRVEEILAYINESGGGEVSIGVIPAISKFNWVTFSYYSLLHQYPTALVMESHQNPLRYDYVITKEGTNLAVSHVLERAKNADSIIKNSHEFELIKKFDLPDSSSALLYRKSGGSRVGSGMLE